jgi:uncharacterized membrane protein
VSPAVVSLVRYLHFIGFALALGGSFAALRVAAAARLHSASEKTGFEGAAAEIITKVELPGLFLALFGGIGLVAANPAVLDPTRGGSWLHIKLALVLGLLVVSHLRMFRARRLVRERAQGASEADVDALHAAVRKLALLDLLLGAGVFFVAVFRFAIFS